MNRIPKPLPESARWQCFSSYGPTAHFYHANGFPTGVYTPLLSLLANEFALSALDNRATWPDIGEPETGISWATYADDLIAYLQQVNSAPVIGMGHSLGATATLIAAHRRPELFKALVLIEPAILTPVQATATRVLPMALKRYLEPIKSTLRKPDQWQSATHFRSAYQHKRAFRCFDQQAMDSLQNHAVVPDSQGGVTLGFPAQWEAWNYANAMNVMPLVSEVRLPTVVIRGKPSLFFSEKMWRRWQRKAPHAVFLENTEFGHLLPLEHPQSCYRMICQGLAQLGLYPETATLSDSG